MTNVMDDGARRGRPKHFSLLDLNEGDVDPTLNKTIYCVIAKTDDYIVYLDDEMFVQWSTSDEMEWPEGAGPIINRVSLLEAVPVEHLRAEQVFAFRRMVGEGVARLFDEKTSLAPAHDVLDRAEAWVRARNDEIARRWYLVAAFAAAAGCFALAVLLWLLRGRFESWLSADGFQVAVGACMGGVGALLSLMARSRKLDLEPAAGRQLHRIEGAARVLTGALGAVLIALAFKADIFFSFAQDTSKAFEIMLVMCMVAGASERLAPGFIERIEITAHNHGAEGKG